MVLGRAGVSENRGEAESTREGEKEKARNYGSDVGDGAGEGGRRWCGSGDADSVVDAGG